MNKPTSVSNAVLAIWVTLGISVLSAVAGRVTGQISSEAFFGNLFMYGLCAILPYKIGVGRNWAKICVHHHNGAWCGRPVGGRKW